MWGVAIAAPIELRFNCDVVTLRDLGKRSDDSNQTRRLLALAIVYEMVGEAKRRRSVGSAFRFCMTRCFCSTPRSRGAG